MPRKSYYGPGSTGARDSSYQRAVADALSGQQTQQAQPTQAQPILVTSRIGSSVPQTGFVSTGTATPQTKPIMTFSPTGTQAAPTASTAQAPPPLGPGVVPTAYQTMPLQPGQNPQDLLNQQREAAFGRLLEAMSFYGTPLANQARGSIMGQLTGQSAPFTEDVQRGIQARIADEAAARNQAQLESIRRLFAGAGMSRGGGEVEAILGMQGDVRRQAAQAQRDFLTQALLENFAARERALGQARGFLGEEAGAFLQPALADVGLRSRFEVTGESPYSPLAQALAGQYPTTGFGGGQMPGLYGGTRIDRSFGPQLTFPQQAPQGGSGMGYVGPSTQTGAPAPTGKTSSIVGQATPTPMYGPFEAPGTRGGTFGVPGPSTKLDPFFAAAVTGGGIKAGPTTGATAPRAGGGGYLGAGQQAYPVSFTVPLPGVDKPFYQSAPSPGPPPTGASKYGTIAQGPAQAPGGLSWWDQQLLAQYAATGGRPYTNPMIGAGSTGIGGVVGGTFNYGA